MNHEITVQIFSGGSCGSSGSGGDAVSFEEVKRKLISAISLLPVKKVIMGWSRDKALYDKTAAFLMERNIEFYVWFPVFSENNASIDPGPLVDLHGEPVERDSSHGEEDFSFCCPNNPRNIENIIGIYEREFESIPFTGIFLDKIRFPSFAQGKPQGHGFDSVFTCFCPHCLTQYKENGFEPKELEKALSQSTSMPLGIKEYRGNGDYSFEDPVLSAFFSLKAGVITQKVRSICEYFRGKGLRIGLDVFAPFLSAFVGQDIPALSTLADFIKPMMYRAAWAPAGMPYETELLLSETGFTETNKRKKFYSLLNLDPGRKPFDAGFSVNELNNLAAVSACPIHAGMEINRKKDIAEVTPDYIEETVSAYARTGIRGFVLSWNLLDAPDENISKTADVLSRIQEAV